MPHAEKTLKLHGDASHRQHAHGFSMASERLDSSPRMAEQRQQLRSAFGHAVQLHSEPAVQQPTTGWLASTVQQSAHEAGTSRFEAAPAEPNRPASTALSAQRMIEPEDPEQQPAPTAIEVFQQFVQELRDVNFAYSPFGEGNCEALALRLRQRFIEQGHEGSATVTKIGSGRYVIAAPDFIDPHWGGGVVLTDSVPLAGMVHFQNHTAVVLGGSIYDPTCGYVGPEANWFCALEDLEEIDGEEIPFDEDDLDQPSYWRAEGPLDLPRPFARLNANGTLDLLTAEGVHADL